MEENGLNNERLLLLDAGIIQLCLNYILIEEIKCQDKIKILILDIDNSNN